MTLTQQITIDIPQMTVPMANEVRKNVQAYVNKIYFHIASPTHEQTSDELLRRIRNKSVKFSELQGIFNDVKPEESLEQLKEEHMIEKYGI